MDKLFYYEIGLNLHTRNIPYVRINRLAVKHVRLYKMFSIDPGVSEVLRSRVRAECRRHGAGYAMLDESDRTKARRRLSAEAPESLRKIY